MSHAKRKILPPLNCGSAQIYRCAVRQVPATTRSLQFTTGEVINHSLRPRAELSASWGRTRGLFQPERLAIIDIQTRSRHDERPRLVARPAAYQRCLVMQGRSRFGASATSSLVDLYRRARPRARVSHPARIQDRHDQVAGRCCPPRASRGSFRVEASSHGRGLCRQRLERRREVVGQGPP